MFRSCARTTSVSLSLSLLGGLGSLLSLASFQGPGDGPPPTPVRAIRAALQETQAREAVTGSLKAAYDAELAAREEGAVLAVTAREGRMVRRGDTLVEIDTKRLAAQREGVAARLAEAQAAAIRAAAEAEDADLDLTALEAAAKGGSAVSDRELRRARTLAKSLRAGVNAAGKRSESLSAELDLWDLRLADATLRAPFDGTVVENHVEVGEWVSPGTPLVRLVSSGNLEVWLDLPEGLMSSTAELTKTGTLRLQAGSGNEAVVATDLRAIPRVDPGTRTFPIVASIQGESAAGLSPGMSASAWIPVGEKTSTLLVPKDSLVYRPGGISVMTVGGRDEGGASVGGVAVMVPIRILFETEREVAVEIVEGGLQAGAVVIVEGNERLFPGTPVNASIRPPAPADESRPSQRNGAGQ
ncbi:Efflux pump periplasmic linker BepF [Planctomycetes bacterium Poly30]|uniref:Efflux pump periplasmic linker BepF n=1 Tax=Saltatorellus ferox TaxID=2528018 RepID=A0A518EP96_9BACT|nr:Efflux pump periplasmic linker BepF [Planctomycetes bacterium Poly30]